MPSEEQPRRVINHKTLRKGTGLVALLMPWLVVFLSGLPEAELPSVSASYWTDSRDIFVGCLMAVAFFMMAYNGTGSCRRDLEFWLSKVAGVSAVFVALFPSGCTLNQCGNTAEWVMYLSSGCHAYIHLAAAILLFVCLILLIAFFSLRAKNKGKLFRSRIYFTISLSMLVGMPAVFAIGHYTDWYQPTFWVEWMGLTLFGVGWIIAGWYKSEPVEPVPDSAICLGEFDVDPRNPNFATNIVVEAGAQYLFLASGCWKDWYIECGPHGWGPDWNPFAYWNRIKWRPLFLLCGNIGKSWNDEHRTFCIGDRYIWTVPSEFNELDSEQRKLYLFTNDWKSKYGNNYALDPDEGGPLKVIIYRL